VITQASTLSSRPSAAGGPVGDLLPTSLPLPTATPTVSLPVSTSGLPVLGGSPCVQGVTCPTQDPGGDKNGNNNGNNNQSGRQSGSGATSPTAAATLTAVASPTASVSRIGARTNPGSTAAALNIGPPPSVLAIGPASSLSFGKAPFLWPLFAVLDAMGLGAVVWVVRRTWSRSRAD
jgi:hypothetical protein